MNKLKQWIKAPNNGRKLIVLLCLNISFLIVGLFYCTVGIYSNLILEKPENIPRIYIGCSSIAIWYLSFPFLSRKSKENLLLHVYFSFLSLIGYCFVVYYLLFDFNQTPSLWKDILFALMSIPLIAYSLYVLYCIIHFCMLMIKKIVLIILPTFEDKKNGLLTTLEAITSIVISITALGAALFAFKNAMVIILTSIFGSQ